MTKPRAKEPRDLVAELGRAARAAGDHYDRQGVAFDRERAAEVALLEMAIGFARPGLPSICSRVAEVPEAVQRLELVAGIFILEDGRLARASLPGSPSVNVISASEALESYELADILSALSDAMKRQIAGREPSTTAATRRAERLEALAKLVE